MPAQEGAVVVSHRQTKAGGFGDDIEDVWIVRIGTDHPGHPNRRVSAALDNRWNVNRALPHLRPVDEHAHFIVLIVADAAEHGVHQHGMEQPDVFLLLRRSGLAPEAPQAEARNAVNIDNPIDERLQTLAPDLAGPGVGDDGGELIADAPYIRRGPGWTNLARGSDERTRGEQCGRDRPKQLAP